MGELLILAYGLDLYTSKHRLDKAANVGSIPTSPTKLNSTACVKNSLTMGPTAGDLLIQSRWPGESRVDC